jgi:phosphatidylglycerophosphate synthase
MLHFAPNALTLARLAMGLAFPFAAHEWQPWLILIAAATDLIDGRLARWLGADGSTGRYLDPVADKVFVLGVLASVVGSGLVSPAALLLVISRDLVVVLGTAGLLLAGQGSVLRRLRPSLLGKVTTALQLIYFFLVFWVRGPVMPVLVVVAVLSASAGIDYIRRGYAALSGRAASVPASN